MKFDNKIELFLTQIDLKFRENQLNSCTTPYFKIQRKSAIFDNKFMKNQ